MAQSGTETKALRLFLSLFAGLAFAACDVDKLGTKYKITDLEPSSPQSNDGTVLQPEPQVKPDPNSSGVDPEVSPPTPDTATSVKPAEITLSIKIDDLNLVEGSTTAVAAVLSSTLAEEGRFTWVLTPIVDTEEKKGKADFVAMIGDFSIEVGFLSKRFEIVAINDFIKEGVENFDLFITEPDLKFEKHIIVSVSDGKDYIKGLVAAGDKHGCAAVAGILYCWGLNADGEAGTSDAVMKSTATKVPTMEETMEYVAAQYSHTCGIKKTALYCWGRNDQGQLGDNSTNLKRSATPVVGLTSGVSAVATGRAHTCAIQKGALKCWGFNDSGQLGDDSTAEQHVARDLPTMATNVTDLAAGISHTCGIKAGGLFCWGKSDVGQLGMGNTESKKIPTLVPNFDIGVTQVAANGNQTCAIKDQRLYCWGNNQSAQLGVGTDSNDYSTPQLVTLLTDVVAGVSMGLEHTCAIINTLPYCWGRGAEGQLGNSFLNNLKIPGRVEPFDDQVISIAAGSYHTCMVGITKKSCWGQGNNWQLGDGLRATIAVPSDIVFPP
jgi:alpha-tubulin suppressor-like RCC1 family protein